MSTVQDGDLDSRSLKIKFCDWCLDGYKVEIVTRIWFVNTHFMKDGMITVEKDGTLVPHWIE